THPGFVGARRLIAEPTTVEMRRLGDRGWRIVFLASLGGTLEFYDFVIFGIFARDIAEALFPSGSVLVSLMASFSAFAAGYLPRPIGGVVLRHLGGPHGRRRGVLLSLFVLLPAAAGLGPGPSVPRGGGGRR